MYVLFTIREFRFDNGTQVFRITRFCLFLRNVGYLGVTLFNNFMEAADFGRLFVSDAHYAVGWSGCKIYRARLDWGLLQEVEF